VLSNIELPALRRKAATDKLVEKIVKLDSWPIQPDILSPPLLWLISRKPLWLDLQPVDVKSRWRHNWKFAHVVNSHLVCDPTIRQPGFDLPWQQWSLLNCFRMEQGHCSACRRKWRLTDTICVLVVRPRRCPTLSNCVPWQNWMVAYLGYTLRMKTLFCGWPVVAHDTHARRRRLLQSQILLRKKLVQWWWWWWMMMVMMLLNLSKQEMNVQCHLNKWICISIAPSCTIFKLGLFDIEECCYL